jgi:hypothetical protein
MPASSSGRQVGGMFGVYFRATPPTSYAEVMESDKDAFNRFFHLMLLEGVYLAPSAFEAGFVSAAHRTRTSTPPSPPPPAASRNSPLKVDERGALPRGQLSPGSPAGPGSEGGPIDESNLVLHALTDQGEASIPLAPTCRPDKYLRLVRELLSGHALGSPGGYPVYLSRWTRHGQMEGINLGKLLLTGEPEAVVAVVYSPA